MLNSLVGIIASSGGAAAGTAYESIASATGTGSSDTITFSSIPSTYTSLQIRFIGRTTASDVPANLHIRLNGDTGSNYAQHQLSGDGTTVTASGLATQTRIRGGAISTAAETAGIMGVNIIDIHDYASTTRNKTIRIFSGVDKNGAGGFVELGSGLWASTSAVNSVSLFTTVTGGSWSTNSTFALYGIKGA